MKKYLIVLVSLLMVGCSSSNPKMETSQTLFTVNGKEYTENDVLNQILELDYGQFLIRELEEAIMNEVIENFDYDIEDKISEELKNFEIYAESMGMSLSDLVNFGGYGDLDGFKEQLKRSITMDLYAQDVIKEDYDALVQKYQLQNIWVFEIDSEDIAKQMVRYAQSDYPLDEFLDEFKVEVEVPFIYHADKTNLDEITKGELNTISKTKGFYVKESDEKMFVYILNEAALIKEEAITTILQETRYKETLMSDLVKNKNLKIINKNLKENMLEDFSSYIQ